MALKNIEFNELIKDEELTFLVGAGCSVDAPSCLPAGRPMMDAIIRYICAESEIENVLKIDELRFEALMDALRQKIDEDLRIIDYYGLCDKPNLQHFFLAEMMKQGQFVMTTNFDFLIEYALLQSGIPKENVLPVITKEGFEKYRDPYELNEQGIFPVYKIHGSTKNIISGESTRDSLVATIQAFGSNKEGMNVFQVEPFKRRLFNYMSDHRSIIIMGYSGSDDFDIVPTLKVLENIQKVIWLNYHNDLQKAQITKIDDDFIQQNQDLDKVTQILVEIKRMENALEVYRVDVNTSFLIQELLNKEINLSNENFNSPPKEYLINIYGTIEEILKIFFPYIFYFDFNLYDDCLRCAKQLINVAEREGKYEYKADALNTIGKIYYERKKYNESLEWYQKAIEVDEKENNFEGKVIHLNNIGLSYKNLNNNEKAIEKFKEALTQCRQMKEKKGIALSLNNLGEIHLSEKKYEEALNELGESMKINEQLGDLGGKATNLMNIGKIYKDKDDYKNAFKNLNEALQIASELGDLRKSASVLTVIGDLHTTKYDYTKALKSYNQGLDICEKSGDTFQKGIILKNIQTLLFYFGKLDEAMDYGQQSFKLLEPIGDPLSLAQIHHNLGVTFFKQGKYTEAIYHHHESAEYYKTLNLFKEKYENLRSVGCIYVKQGELEKASQFFEGLEEICRNQPQHKFYLYKQLGFLYFDQTKYGEAEHYFHKAYEESHKEFPIEKKKIEEQAELHILMGTCIRLNKSEAFGEEMKKKAFKEFEMVYDEFEFFKIKNQRLKAEALNGMGVLSIEMYTPTYAVIYLEEAIDLYETLGYLPGKAQCLFNNAYAYSKQEKYELALNNFDKAIEIYNQLNDITRKAEALHHVGNIYLNLREMEKAVQTIEEALKFNEELGDKKSKIVNLDKLGDIYFDLGNLELAKEKYYGSMGLLKELDLLDTNFGQKFKEKLDHLKQRDLLR